MDALRNPERTGRVLTLLTALRRNEANAHWADRIYHHLADHRRRPERKQREVVGLTF